MEDEELKKLQKESELHKDKINCFIEKTYPQIGMFKDSHRKYYEYIVTACGVFAGLTQALLASNFQKINFLAVLGFVFFIIAVIISFLGFKRDLILSAKYTKGLKQIQKILSDFSGDITKFSRNEISPEEYKKKQVNFRSKYPDLRYNSDMGETDAYENTILEEIIDCSFSNLNLITATFLIGLVLVTLSVILPQIVCFGFSVPDPSA